jgi:serine protease Do
MVKNRHNMKDPFSNTNNKRKSDVATFSTRPERAYNFKMPSKFQKPKAPKFLRTRLSAALAAAVLFFGISFGGGWLGARSYNHDGRAVANSTAAKQQYISNESELISSIAKTVGQSVVSVDVQSQVQSRDFFGYGQTQNQEAAGTGFILSSDGIIVTNRHVVPPGTTSVSVTLSDGTHYDNVEVVGRTSSNSSQDVAFLKISDLKGKTVVPVTLGDSSKMQVGDRVIAIGNALGQFQNTVTSGIISGFGRDVTAGDQSGAQTNESLTDLFQTDAAINEGNSGGPLVNINGEVIGINTAIAAQAQNIGFAQPINDMKGLITSVLGGGKLEQPYLGVRYVSLTNDLAKEFNISVKRGAYITSGSGQEAVVAGSPAEKAGLKDKDVITKVNNITVDDKTSLTAALSRFRVDDKVTLTIIRDGKTTTKQATLEAAPQS